MSLGSRILLSIFSISILIASIGITSNWYTNSIHDQLLDKNIKTTNMVELTANIENELYHSLITLIALKESLGKAIPYMTLQEPTQKMHFTNFNTSILSLENQLSDLDAILELQTQLTNKDLLKNLEELNRRFIFYKKLSFEWLEFRDEDKFQSDQMFVTSLTPYFSNKIIPIISKFREEVIAQQIQENAVLDTQLDRAGIFIISISTILVIISIAIAFYLYNSIANPLKKLSKGTQVLGEGNLDERLDVSNNDEIGELAKAFNLMASNLQKRTISRDYLDNIIESIHETLIVTDDIGDIVWLNKATEELLGHKKSELISTPLSSLLDGDHAILQKESPKSILDKTIETILISKNGDRIPVLFSESDLINSKDEFFGKVVVATDITERNKANEQIRESLKEKEVLLAEIHHRVKNNLAVVSGILQLQSRDSNNQQVEEALAESQTRIKSISLVHEMLYQSETLANINYDEYVLDLIDSISNLPITSDKEINITVETEKLLLDLNIAVPCSMLLNEIIVDRLKNSFNESFAGAIHVIIRNLDSNVELSVEHNGCNKLFNNPKETLGYTLIKTLINQLRGTYYEEYLKDRDRYRIRIVFPTKKNAA